MANLLPLVQSQITQLSLNIEHLSKDITLVQSHLDQKFSQLRREMNNRDDALTITLEQFRQKFESAIANFEKKYTQLQESKMDQKETYQMMDANRGQIYEDLQLIKNELTYQRKNFESSLAEKFKKVDLVSLQEQMLQLKDHMKIQRQEDQSLIHENSTVLKQLVNANKKGLLQEIDRIVHTIESFKLEVQEQMQRTISKAEQETLEKKLALQLEQKADLIEVQNALNTAMVDTATRFQDFKDEVKTVLELQSSEFFNQLNRKVNLSEFNQQIQQKVELAQLVAYTEDKVPLKEFQSYIQLIENLAIDFQSKCSLNQFEEFQLICNNELEFVKGELKKVISKQKIKEALDKKANHEDVSRAFSELQAQLVKKLPLEDFKQFQASQLNINEQVCTENIVARWLFKSNFLSPGSLVPWNVQVINTLPDNFLWERDKANLLIVSPGLYEIQLGFFAKKKPKIDIMVNGETIIGAVNNSSYVIHHSSGKLKDTKSSITGLTMIDFILLPARARLNIAYQGEIGEGFINLRKM